MDDIKDEDCVDAGGGGDEAKSPPIHAWYLVDPQDKKLRLPRTMLFLGRDECDIIIQSGTVDKRHAVITFDLYLSRFKVKDLSTTNGTYVNESRIPEQEYVTLNHMDSIRLGHDSKVYHMEQGEPCTGDTPSPTTPPQPTPPPSHTSPFQQQQKLQQAAPGSPASLSSSVPSSSPLMSGVGSGEGCELSSSLPPTSAMESAGGDPHAFLPHPPPTWSSRPHHAHRPGSSSPRHHHSAVMAECQGCIAEQKIEHTCTHGANPSSTTPPHHQHHHHHDSSHSPRFVDVQRKPQTQDSHVEKPVGLGGCFFSLSDDKPDPAEADDADEEAALLEEKVCMGRNTWPRKKVRQARRAATDLFGDSAADDCDGRVVVDDDEIAVESGANYFVSVDDSAVVCDSASAGGRGAGSGGRRVVEFVLSRTGSVHRIPRNSKNVPLPPELETVKKGTPLYGQPSWWGEDTDNGEKEGKEASHKKGEDKSPRPSTLGMAQGHGDTPPKQQQQKQQQHRDTKPVYMEIPHHSDTPERDKDKAPHPHKKSRDKTTPARSSTSSLSKDSLVVSPGSGRERSVDKESESDETVGGSGKAGSSEPAANAALSFTVDLGDDEKVLSKKKPKLHSGASLSQFVPPKLRNSLSSHHAGRSDKASSSSRDGSCKNSEERELSSPVPIAKQRKVEEQAVVGSVCSALGETPSKGKSARRSSAQGTGVGSLRSGDFPAESTPPASSAKSRREPEKRPSKETEKEADKRIPKAQEPRKPSSRSQVSSKAGSKAVKGWSLAEAIAGSAVQAAQYSDPTAYLIDRMFAGATDSPRSECSDPERTDSPTAPEHVMYKEAREYDLAAQRGSATYRASPGNGTKSAQQQQRKQKSLSKSPAASHGKSPGTGRASTGSPRSPAATASSPKSAKAASNKPPAEKQPRASKEKSREPERPQAATASAGATPALAPQTLPEAPSPIPRGGPEGDQEDKVSEAGTYTIEAEEEDGKEELMARQQIDELYGVVDLNGFSFERPVIASASEEVLRGSQDDADDDDEVEEEEDKTLHDDVVEGASVQPLGCHTPEDDDATENIFDDDGDDDYVDEVADEVVDEEGVMSRSMGEEEVPSWVSQLNSLTAGIRQSPAKDTDDASKKPPQGLNRKRPGTGRKLPSIPTGNDQSPVSSEHSHSSPASAVNGSGAARLLENGHNRSMDDSPSTNTKCSPVAAGGGGDRVRGEGSPSGSEGSGANNVNSAFAPKPASLVSRGSIDTELLLRDTETVMAAMEARMGFHQEDKGREGHHDHDEDDAESDTDLTSTRALVNGDEDFVKPTKYHSPRDTMSGKVNKEKDNSNIRIASSSSKKSLVRSFSEQKPPMRSDRSARSGVGSGAGVSVVSDVLSRDSLDHSFQSDASDGGSSDRTDSTFSRSGSRGKGTITMTKPNRAFALRRARADGTETATDTARSRGSAASSSAASGTTRRSSSIHGTPRTTYSDRTGTEASLGAQIVKKSREGTGTPKGRESSITRQDGVRRNSLRAGDRRSSAGSTASSSTVSSAKKERDIRSLKSQLKSGPANRDLAITGTSSGSRSQSQPGSRSNSPKAAERMAWKRRKEYDPRKAVAEAKANRAKESSSQRPKPKVQAASSLYKQRMTRSASFTNSAELSGRARHDTYTVDSISSAEDLSSSVATVSEAYSDTGFRRAFMPFHNPRRADRMHHSADEDETAPLPMSQDAAHTPSVKPSVSQPVSLALHKSAFTPPLSKLHTPSPDSPSPQASLLLRRRTLGASDFGGGGATSCSALYSQRSQADVYSTHSTSPQSYDSLIVSSIYQLTLKLKTTMDKALIKLRDQDRASITPSPMDDFLGHPVRNEIPAWKSANQELAGVLKNLRSMERQIHSMERALFPDEDTDTDVSGMSSTEKHKYYQEIERIRSELAGFHPIHSPQSQSADPGSPEMAELSKNIK